MRDRGREGRAGVKDGKDGDDDDQMDAWCFLERKTEMRMTRWMRGVSLKERQPSTELRRRLGVEAIGNVMRRGRLRWHGRVERKDDADYDVTTYTRLVVGRPRNTWQTLCQVFMGDFWNIKFTSLSDNRATRISDVNTVATNLPVCLAACCSCPVCAPVSSVPSSPASRPAPASLSAVCRYSPRSSVWPS